MREIKIRAWDTDKNAWYCMEIFRGGHSGPTHRETSPFIFDVGFGKNIVLMQYTGLKDKNGVEIYEGDILLSELKDTVEPDGICRVHNEVVFYKGAFCWVGETSGTKHPFSEDDVNERTTVVGNIYQNPELCSA